MPAAQPPETSAADSLFATGPAQTVAGDDPVEVLAEGILDGSAPIDLLLVSGYDPVHDSPAGERLREAMDRIPMVVVLATFPDETTDHAHFVLPTSLYLERWQGTTTPATIPFSSMGVAEPVIETLHDTRHAGDVLLELNRLAGGDAGALPWDTYADYLEGRIEGVAVSRQGAIVTGSFEESWVQFLEERGWRFPESQRPDDYWDELVRNAGWWNPVRPPDNWDSLFGTDSGRFEFWPRGLERLLGAIAADAADEDPLAAAIATLGLEADPQFVCLPHFEPPRFAGEGELIMHPFRPITSRGSLGKYSPMVLEMFGYTVLSGWTTWAELAPETAADLGIGDGDRIELASDRGSIEALVHTYPGSLPGVVHVSLGLGHSFRGSGVIGSNPMRALLEVRDPVSGTLSENSTRVSLTVIERRSHGVASPAHGEGA
jgi:anaerobic selenocysteine-containing dehydrogenase